MPRRLSPCGDSRRQGCATGPMMVSPLLWQWERLYQEASAPLKAAA